MLWVLTCRDFVALVLMISGGTKLVGLRRFVVVVRNFQLCPARLAQPVAYSLPCLELLTSLALLSEWSPRLAGLLAAGLFLLFGAAVAINLLRGRREIDCGCFGSSHRSRGLTWGLVGRNLLLAVSMLAVSVLRLRVGAEHPQGEHQAEYAVSYAALLLLLTGVVSLLLRLKHRFDELQGGVTI
jgi:hypothetical protein